METSGVDQMDSSIVETADSSIFKKADSLTWNTAKNIFINELHTHVNNARMCDMTSNWSTMYNIGITITYNKNANKYCCWEAGGANNQDGVALIVGLPSGDKPLALAAFRNIKYPNNTHAVVQVWRGCVVAIAAQSRGEGIVLLYRIQDIIPTEFDYSEYIDSKKPIIKHKFTAMLQLCKVIDISNNRSRQFNSDLSNISDDHEIIKTAIRKATIYNCKQALYIRRFFFIKEGYKDWDINDIAYKYTNVYSEPTESIVAINEILALASAKVKTIDKFDSVFILMKSEDSITKSADDDSVGIYTKFVVISENKLIKSSVIYVTPKLFSEFKDLFEYSSYKDFANIQNGSDEFRKISVARYVGN